VPCNAVDRREKTLGGVAGGLGIKRLVGALLFIIALYIRVKIPGGAPGAGLDIIYATRKTMGITPINTMIAIKIGTLSLYMGLCIGNQLS